MAMKKRPATPRVQIVSLRKLKQDPRNANKGTPRGGELLEESIKTYGLGRSVLADKHGTLIAGNKTALRAAAAGVTDAIVVKTDGTRVVVVQRTDLDLAKDPRAKALAIADNRVAELDLAWNGDELAALQASGVDLAPAGFSAADLAALTAADDDLEAVKDEAVPERFAVIITCRSEADQTSLIKRLTKEGRECRALMS